MSTIGTPKPAPALEIAPVRRFAELSLADVQYAGGKGASLGELTRSGFPVPPGFVVGAPAYARFRHESGLGDRLTELLTGLDVEDTAALRTAADSARRAVAASEMPEWLSEAIGSAYEQLADGEDDMSVAVRSSTTGEDTASASFAGMNETFLNVRGRQAVIGAVKRCWESLFGPRTIYHRAKRGFSHSDADLAVAVQRQIPSTRSGVMFTIDPATGDRHRLVIEGSFGLGEAVVSGQVSPDRYVVDKSRLAIVTRSVRPKELVIEAAAHGGTVSRALAVDESHRPALTDDEVLCLAELGLAIEREYGSPQDTEWAFDPDGWAWMLQSRQTTAPRPARP